MSDTIPAPGFDLDALLREQRRRWEKRSPIRVEELLGRYPALRDRKEALLDLINHEIVLRSEFAAQPTRDEYIGRFPDLRNDLVMLFDVQEAIDGDEAEERHTVLAPEKPMPRRPLAAALPRGGPATPQEAPGGDGISLGSQLQGMPQPAIAAARLLESLARSVHHAHGLGSVHRDLKPDSILLQKVGDAHSGRGEPAAWTHGGTAYLARIADFGPARQLRSGADSARTQAIVGTPSYMAPEQAGDFTRPTSSAADIYSLGAILYELITGRPPFRGENALDTLEQVRTLDVICPRRLQPRCPRDLETICLKCLRKNPAQRYASAQELADDLNCFLRNAPIRARPTSAWEHIRLWCRRHPALAAMIGTIVVLTLLSEGILVYLALRGG